MHSVHHSRGRVLFDFACALGLVASLVGAWQQTGASALLAAASFAALYGFVRLFDLGQPKQTEAVEPQRIDFEPETEIKADLPVIQDVVVPFEAPVQPLTAFDGIEEDDAEPAARKTKPGRRTKAPRKSGGRRVASLKDEKVAELVTPEAVEAAEFVLPEEAEAPGFAPHEDLGADEFPSSEEAAQSHIAPLFEPEPFARMPRRAFGRRGQI